VRKLDSNSWNRGDIGDASERSSARGSGDYLTANEFPEDRRHSSRINQSQTVRIRPAESKYSEEIRTTLNVSWDGFYFATSADHYASGMVVYVTRDYRANNPGNREEKGSVVRVDNLKEGRWGIAVQLARDVWTNKIS
jgi:hypothetical protein